VVALAALTAGVITAGTDTTAERTSRRPAEADMCGALLSVAIEEVSATSTVARL
jgi:hypothetical protein